MPRTTCSTTVPFSPGSTSFTSPSTLNFSTPPSSLPNANPSFSCTSTTTLQRLYSSITASPSRPCPCGSPSSSTAASTCPCTTTMLGLASSSANRGGLPTSQQRRQSSSASTAPFSSTGVTSTGTRRQPAAPALAAGARPSPHSWSTAPSSSSFAPSPAKSTRATRPRRPSRSSRHRPSAWHAAAAAAGARRWTHPSRHHHHPPPRFHHCQQQHLRLLGQSVQCLSAVPALSCCRRQPRVSSQSKTGMPHRCQCSPWHSLQTSRQSCARDKTRRASPRQPPRRAHHTCSPIKWREWVRHSAAPPWSSTLGPATWPLRLT
mmetsp:Transcript_13481/g.42449  ORF Transcript_13481/g.42449 Transcript_13481/m.42449 type:complete len:319 (+) Transcript_13481:363-1319(+)